MSTVLFILFLILAASPLAMSRFDGINPSMADDSDGSGGEDDGGEAEGPADAGDDSGAGEDSDDDDGGGDDSAPTPDEIDQSTLMQAMQHGISPDEAREFGLKGTLRAIALAQRLRGGNGQPKPNQTPAPDEDDKPFTIPAFDEETLHPSVAAAIKSLNDHYANSTKTLRSEVKKLRESETRRERDQRRSEIGRWLKGLGDEYATLFPTRSLGSLDAVTQSNLRPVLELAGSIAEHGYDTDEALNMALRAAHPKALADIERRKLAKQIRERPVTMIGKGAAPTKNNRPRKDSDQAADDVLDSHKVTKFMFGGGRPPAKKASPPAKK